MHEYIHIYITNAITNNDHLMRDAYWMLNIFQNLFSAFGNFKSFGSLCNTMEVQKWNFLIITTTNFTITMKEMLTFDFPTFWLKQISEIWQIHIAD